MALSPDDVPLPPTVTVQLKGSSLCTVATRTVCAFPAVRDAICTEVRDAIRTTTEVSRGEWEQSPMVRLDVTREQFAIALNRFVPVLTPQEEAELCRAAGIELFEEVDWTAYVRERARAAASVGAANSSGGGASCSGAPSGSGVVGGEGLGRGGGRAGTGGNDGNKRRVDDAPVAGGGDVRGVGGPSAKRAKVSSSSASSQGLAAAVSSAFSVSGTQSGGLGSVERPRRFRFPHDILLHLGVPLTKLQKLLFEPTLPPTTNWRDAWGGTDKKRAFALVDMHVDAAVRDSLDRAELGESFPDESYGKDDPAQSSLAASSSATTQGATPRPRPPLIGTPLIPPFVDAGGISYRVTRAAYSDSAFSADIHLQQRDDTVVLHAPGWGSDGRRILGEEPASRALRPQPLARILLALGLHRWSCHASAAMTGGPLQEEDAAAPVNDPAKPDCDLCAALLDLRFGDNTHQLILAGGSVFRSYLGQDIGGGDLDSFLCRSAAEDDRGQRKAAASVDRLAHEAVSRIAELLRRRRLTVVAVQRSRQAVTWYVRCWRLRRVEKVDGATSWKPVHVVCAIQLIGLYASVSAVLESFDIAACQICLVGAPTSSSGSSPASSKGSPAQPQVLATPAGWLALSTGLLPVRTAPFEMTMAEALEEETRRVGEGAESASAQDLARLHAAKLVLECRWYVERVLKYVGRGMGAVLAAGVGQDLLRAPKRAYDRRGAWSGFSGRSALRHGRCSSVFSTILRQGEERAEADGMDNPPASAKEESEAERKTVEGRENSGTAACSSPVMGLLSDAEDGPDCSSGVPLAAPAVGVADDEESSGVAVDPENLDAGYAAFLQRRMHLHEIFAEESEAGRARRRGEPAAELAARAAYQREHGVSYICDADSVSDILHPSGDALLPAGFDKLRAFFGSGRMPTPQEVGRTPVMSRGGPHRFQRKRVPWQPPPGWEMPARRGSGSGAAGSGGAAAGAAAGSTTGVRWRFGENEYPLVLSRELRAALGLEKGFSAEEMGGGDLWDERM